MPTRLLEVLNDGKGAKLHPTNGQHTRYVALSYTWGGSIGFATTKSTYMSRHSQFATSELPQTIQDAIHVTRCLKVQYLWVDSLCIIQDSSEDKAAEISRMDAIYQNAFVTVSATNAPSAYRGFLDAEYGDESRRRLPLFYPDGTRGHAFVGDDPWYRTEPLDRRAWALQERLLSNCLLQYTSVGLQASCREGDYAIASDQTYNNAGRTLPECLRIVWRGKANEVKEEATMLEAWDEILALYTDRLLTNPQDKLPALSGLATRFQARLQSDYCAGIWGGQYFPRGLLWHGKYAFGYKRFRKELVPLRRISSTSNDKATPPTWSWASVEGPVMSDYANVLGLRYTLRVLDCSVALQNPAMPFGEAGGGILSVRGVFRDCLCSPSASGQQARLDVDSIGLDITPDDLDEWSAALKGTTIRLLEIGRERNERRGTSLRFWRRSSAYRSFGLMLKRASSSDVRYRRLGYFFEMDAERHGFLFQKSSRATIEIE